VVTLQEGDNDTSRTISIRGVGPQSGGLIINNQNATTGVLLDDVSLTDPYGSFLIPDLDPFDLHDLEVLKGPQGTLFGAGALNGAIRYVLNKHQSGVTETKGFANYLKLSQQAEDLAREPGVAIWRFSAPPVGRRRPEPNPRTR